MRNIHTTIAFLLLSSFSTLASAQEKACGIVTAGDGYQATTFICYQRVENGTTKHYWIASELNFYDKNLKPLRSTLGTTPNQIKDERLIPSKDCSEEKTALGRFQPHFYGWSAGAHPYSGKFSPFIKEKCEVTNENSTHLRKNRQ